MQLILLNVIVVKSFWQIGSYSDIVMTHSWYNAWRQHVTKVDQLHAQNSLLRLCNYIVPQTTWNLTLSCSMPYGVSQLFTGRYKLWPGNRTLGFLPKSTSWSGAGLQSNSFFSFSPVHLHSRWPISIGVHLSTHLMWVPALTRVSGLLFLDVILVVTG